MAKIYVDDKRLLPEFGEATWCERKSERPWHYCKYCYKDTPTFILREGLIGDARPTQVLRCCWECGSGLEIIYSYFEERGRNAPEVQNL